MMSFKGIAGTFMTIKLRWNNSAEIPNQMMKEKKGAAL
jgi:hypothetical protein